MKMGNDIDKYAYKYARSKGENEEIAHYFAQLYDGWMEWFLLEEMCGEQISKEEYTEGSLKMLANADCEIGIYKNLIGKGHSSKFAKLVANGLDEYDHDHLNDAYDLLGPEDAWNEAYNEYKMKDKGEIFCQRIADRIKNRIEYFVDFRTIENEINEYESCFYQAIKDGKNSELAHFYADRVTLAGYNERYAYGLMLMKERLINEFRSNEYTEQFLRYLQESAVSYDELDYQTFLPGANDFYRVLRVYGFTDAWFVGIQNNLSIDEIEFLQRASDPVYFEISDTTDSSCKKAMKRVVNSFNHQYPDRQINNWTIHI